MSNELLGPELLAVLRRIEARGTFELAHRVRSICSRVLRYARATGRKCEDVAADLIGLLVRIIRRDQTGFAHLLRPPPQVCQAILQHAG